MGIQLSVSSINMMKSIFFACLVAAVYAEAEPKADADAYYGLGYSGVVPGYTGYALPGYTGYAGYGAYATPAYTAYRGYGYAGLRGHYIGKREAEAEPEADADAYYGYNYGYNNLGYAAPIARTYAAAPVATVARTYAAPVTTVARPYAAYGAYATPTYSAYAGYGYAGLNSHYIGKREAEAEPEADADAYYGYNYGLGYNINNLGYAAPITTVARSYAVAPIARSYGTYGYGLSGLRA